MSYAISIMYLGLLGGAERGSRVLQGSLNSFCDRVRAAEHAPRDPFRVLERLHSFPEIIERGTGVRVEHVSVNRPHGIL